MTEEHTTDPNQLTVDGIMSSGVLDEPATVQGAAVRLTRESIQAASDVTEFEHYVPEWKGNVLLRSITQRRMNDILSKTDTEEGESKSHFGMMLRLVIQAGMADPVIDDDFYEVLMDKSAGAIMGIFEAVMDNSNITEESRKRAEKRVS